MKTNPLLGVVKDIDTISLNSEPINSSWVLEGSPQARNGGHSRNVDGWASTNIWDCTAGRFRWYYRWEETIMILEGEVRVTHAAGQTHVLTTGSIAYFPAGTWWTWEVPQYVRKIAFCRRQVPWLPRVIGKLTAKIGKRLRKDHQETSLGK